MPDAARPDLIYRLAARADWARAEAEGVYRGAEIDARDGYIHFSSAPQLADTARLHYRGRAGLALIAVEARKLGAALRWEESRGGALFPHLYAALNTGDALWVKDVALDADGVPRVEALL